MCCFYWKRVFANKTFNEIVQIFNETICNVLSKYILNEDVSFNDQDPLRINNKINKNYTRILTKIMNPSINPKKYYSILERLSNNKKVL